MSNLKNTIYSACLTVLFCNCISCGEHMLDREEVINQYGPEVINYFYETAFYLDWKGSSEEGWKWEEDIYISMHGTLMEDDSLFVQEALIEINSLNLPVSISLVSDLEKSNIKMFFGSKEYIADSMNLTDNDYYIGRTIIKKTNTNGRISAKIGIADAKTYPYPELDSTSASFLRKMTILEEITQSLGIPGDSFTYYDSRFFQERNKVGGLSDIDKKAIEFLYDKKVFRNHRINRKDFEKRFSKVLYNRISAGKFGELAHEYGLSQQDLDSLGKMVFRPETKDTFVKFPRNAFVKLSGDSTQAHLNFCKALVGRFNAITPYFQLELEESKTIWNEFPSITIHYEEGEEYKETVYSQTAVSTYKMMFTYQIAGDVWIKFYNPKKEIIPYSKVIFLHNKKLTRALFEILGLDAHGNILINGDQDSLEINKKYEDYFQFLYDPRFPSGISKAEFEKLLKSIN